jgi:hypothetical protein
VKISDIKTISDINSSFNSAYQSRLFADSINTSKNLNTLSLYYTIHDKQPLYVSDRKTGIGYLYSIDQSNNSILKTDLKSNKDIALNLKFDRIIILNNKIYARTIQGNWLQEISQTLETRFSNTSLEESKTVENEWNNILQSIDKSKKNYIQSIDQAQVKYKGELINISNGFLIYDESGTLYAKLNDSEPYKKVLGNNKYELIPGNDVAIKLKQLDGLKKKYDDILKSQSTYQANDMALPLKSNSFLYKIDNKGVLSKNNKPYNPVFYILLNTESGVAIKTSDNNWLLESNGYFYGVPEAKYKEYNNYLITAMAVKNSNKYRNTVGTINNLEQCSNSESCVNKHAYCRTGSELCMYDDECQFKYRENTPEQRKLLCEKMLKNVAWFICSNPDNEIKSNNVPIILPNTIYDDTFVKPCYSVMTETNSNCVTVLGIHNLFQLLINLERLAISSKDLTAAPAHIEITQSPNEIYKLVVTSWNRNSVLFDIDSRRTVADKLEIKPLSLENLRFGASSKLDLILLKQ